MRFCTRHCVLLFAFVHFGYAFSPAASTICGCSDSFRHSLWGPVLPTSCRRRVSNSSETLPASHQPDHTRMPKWTRDKTQRTTNNTTPHKTTLHPQLHGRLWEASPRPAACSKNLRVERAAQSTVDVSMCCFTRLGRNSVSEQPSSKCLTCTVRTLKTQGELGEFTCEPCTRNNAIAIPPYILCRRLTPERSSGLRWLSTSLTRSTDGETQPSGKAHPAWLWPNRTKKTSTQHRTNTSTCGARTTRNLVTSVGSHATP